MIVAYIGLGANLGDTHATLQRAAAEIAALPGVRSLQISPLYRSAPIDSGGPDYLNGVARIETTLEPHALLGALQRLELEHGRERPYRNAPRTLDLDLLLYGDERIDTPTLTVPHPRMHERAFVLRPLKDLAPALRLEQGSLEQLLARCAGQPIEPA